MSSFLFIKDVNLQTDICFNTLKWSIASEMFRMVLEEKQNKP